MNYKIIFKIFELSIFIIPIVPSQFKLRLIIMFIYFYSHIKGVPKIYNRIKTNIISNENNMK
jgi:hypothetical protein